MTGIGDTYEEPESPDLVVETGVQTLEESTEQIVGFLIENRIIKMPALRGDLPRTKAC